VGQATVHFNLFFAHAARRAAAALAAALAPPGAGRFAVEVTPHPRQAWQRVLHPREFHLQARLLGLGPLGENIQNDLFAINHAQVGKFFPLALLRGCQPVVDDDHVAFMGAGKCRNLRSLAGAAEEFLVHLPAARQHRLRHLDVEGAHQLPELLEQGTGFLGFARVEIKPHQQRAFDHLWFLSDLKHPRKE